MEEKYHEQFVDFATRKKKESTRRTSNFHLNLMEIQSNKVKAISLNPATDPPLPDWARTILAEPYITKRTRILMLRYHDGNIRAMRLIASRPKPTYDDGRTTYGPDSVPPFYEGDDEDDSDE